MPPKINHNVNKRMFNTQKLFASSTWIYWVLAVVVLVMLFGTCTQSSTMIEYRRRRNNNRHRGPNNANKNNNRKQKPKPKKANGDGFILYNQALGGVQEQNLKKEFAKWGRNCKACKDELEGQIPVINQQKAGYTPKKMPACANANGGRGCKLDKERVWGFKWQE